MPVKKIAFSRQVSRFYFSAVFADLVKRVHQPTAVLITDENVFAVHTQKFQGWNTIVLKAGEAYKIQATVDSVVQQLLAMKADRGWTLVGVGGGVVTDITGYVASVYLRGVAFGFVPTTLLAMVDAAIGGKNGIDVGLHKNMVGTINQPHFLLYDVGLLQTLPHAEWKAGFAEIIKHAAILDAPMYKLLSKKNLAFFQQDEEALQKLVRRNALLKCGVVQEDEFENGRRRLLNFGHTLGHAIEKLQQLSHGEAVAVGMVFAAKLSAELLSFTKVDALIKLIEQYGLPTAVAYDKQQTFELLTADKKKEGSYMNFILLQKPGKAVVKKIPLTELYNFL